MNWLLFEKRTCSPCKHEVGRYMYCLYLVKHLVNEHIVTIPTHLCSEQLLEASCLMPLSHNQMAWTEKGAWMSSSLGMMTDIVEFEGWHEDIGYQVTYNKDNNFFTSSKKTSSSLHEFQRRQTTTFWLTRGGYISRFISNVMLCYVMVQDSSQETHLTKTFSGGSTWRITTYCRP